MQAYQRGEPEERVARSARSNPLDGCLHVYLDVGSNKGFQVSSACLRESIASGT
jgi:hypothetical protein